MSVEENKALIRRLIEVTFHGDLNELDELMDPDVVVHDPAPGQGPGLEGTKEFAENLRQAFPEHGITIEDLIAEGDKVVVRWVVRGLHAGSFEHPPWDTMPTGKEIRVTGITKYRIANGKVAEAWPQWDRQSLMGQLHNV